VSLDHALSGHYHAALCHWLYHCQAANHGLSYIITFPSHLEDKLSANSYTLIKINIDVLLVLQSTLKKFHDDQVLIRSALLLWLQIPIKYAAELRDFNAKHSQSHPKMEAHAKVKEKHIGGCLPNL
jgi:hypothetical protein